MNTILALPASPRRVLLLALLVCVMWCSAPWCADGRALVMRMSRPKFSSASSSRGSSGNGPRPMAAKRVQKAPSNNFYLPGYARNDFALLLAVFNVHASPASNGDGSTELSYDALVKSKYLRFWPGRKSEIEAIWMELTGGADAEARPLTLAQLPALLSRLDEVAQQTEQEMEEERIQWAIDEIHHSHLDTYFDRKARGKTLSFTDFLSFESVQAELWFADGKGLTEAAIATLWERVAGCVSRGIDKATFYELYGAVVSNSLTQP